MITKSCGIILPKHFKTIKKYKEINNKVNKLGFKSISEYLYKKCFRKVHTSGCKIARDLNVSDMTIYHKIKIMRDIMNHKYVKRANNPKYMNGNVHWVFDCGCIYKGQRYRVKNKRVCMKHGNTLNYDIKICTDCKKVFKSGPKYGAKKICDVCLFKRRKSYDRNRGNRKKAGIVSGICSRPGCKNPKPIKNRFLCDKCMQGR